MINHKSLTFFLLILIASLSVSLQATTIPWHLPSNKFFLDLLPLCPKEGSPTEKSDLHFVIAMQAHPTKEQLAHAEKSVALTVFMFSKVLGDSFNADSYPKTAAFFKKLDATASIPKNWIKNRIHRKRPYQAFPNLVKALISTEEGSSFPSGHAMRAWLYAIVLGDLDPARSKDYFACAFQINDDRILGGMHYPSDSIAGRTLAEAIHDALMANPSFRSELAELRKSEFSMNISSH